VTRKKKHIHFIYTHDLNSTKEKMIALPSHRDGILLSPCRTNNVFVHKDHDIILLLKHKWRVDTEHWYLVDNSYYKFKQPDVEYLCLHFARNTIIRLQRWARRIIYARRRLAVAMAFHPRLGRARTPPPLGPVRMRVCRLGTLKEDLLIKILSIAAPL
jgi:hypothetical protein